jgi:hypothetical protein
MLPTPNRKGRDGDDDQRGTTHKHADRLGQQDTNQSINEEGTE